MKAILAFALLLLVDALGVTFAAESETSVLQIAQRKNSQGDPLITTIGMYGAGGNTAIHWDLAKYEDAQQGDAWATEFGAGYLLPTRVNIYIGAGIALGYRVNGREYFADWYPEFGAVVMLTEGFGVSVSRKRYNKLYHQTENVLMFGLVLTPK